MYLISTLSSTSNGAGHTGSTLSQNTRGVSMDTKILYFSFSNMQWKMNIHAFLLFCLPFSSQGPLHDSKMAHTMRVQAYLHHNAEVQQWYEIQHRNWHTVDGHRSRWKVWESTAQLVTPHLKEIQLYIDQIPQGK